jgi:hypothetical protein
MSANWVFTFVASILLLQDILTSKKMRPICEQMHGKYAVFAKNQILILKAEKAGRVPLHAL